MSNYLDISIHRGFIKSIIFGIVFLFGIFLANIVFGSTQQEVYNTGDNEQDACFDDYWLSQSWTASSTYDIEMSYLHLFRVGNGAGDLVLHLRSAIDGTDIASSSLDTSGITTDGGGEWYAMTYNATATITDTNAYYFVMECGDGDVSNYLRVRINTNATYSGGCEKNSSDGGSTWSACTYDILFENWSYDYPTSTASSTLDYAQLLAIISLGLFLIVLIDFLRRLASSV